MSVSLVVIWIELSSDCAQHPKIQYQASRTRVGEVRSGDPVFTPGLLPSRFRGSRELHDIEIETIISPAMSGETPIGARTVASDPVAKSSGSLIAFTSGNHYVETTKGILHLFKENKQTPLSEEAERSDLICILSVPTSMTTHNVIQFVAPMEQDIESIRIIRDSKPTQYMVLVKFRNQKSADEFYRNFNGVAFNSIEPEMCHLVFVEKVETLRETDRRVTQPIPGHTELPTCPVCLERMDESVEGVLTILCNHSFHGKCLDKWGDSSCPVCRYSQTPEPLPQNSCFECSSAPESESEVKSDESLWICLICGHIGCGRYVEGHAYQHYAETQHTYAMQLGNNRVWDYAGDNYVHRLLQNKSDGKMVEVEGNPDQRASDEKIDAVQLEYTYLLTNQLDSQRRYFEERIHRIENENEDRIKALTEKTNSLKGERDSLTKQVAALTKEKNSLDKKLTQMGQKFNKALHDLQEEVQMNKCLIENQEIWQKKLQEVEASLQQVKQAKDTEVSDLKEQVRDLMFYLEAQAKLQDVPDATKEEIESGSVYVPPNQTEASAGSSSSGKQRRKKSDKF